MRIKHPHMIILNFLHTPPGCHFNRLAIAKLLIFIDTGELHPGHFIWVVFSTELLREFGGECILLGLFDDELEKRVDLFGGVAQAARRRLFAHLLLIKELGRVNEGFRYQ